MKKRDYIILGITTVGLYFLYSKIFKTKNIELETNDDSEKEDDSENNNELKSILFVGDSISIDKSRNKPLNFTYTSLIRKDLKPKGIDVDVLAIGGKRTSWMLEQLPKALTKKKYSRVYIFGGINDMFSSTTKQTAYNNIQKMVDLVIKSGAEPYVIVGYDARKMMTKEKLNPTKYVPTKDAMFKLAQRYYDFQDNIKDNIKNTKFVDKIDIGGNTGDGSHPNQKGHKLLKEGVMKTII